MAQYILLLSHSVAKNGCWSRFNAVGLYVGSLQSSLPMRSLSGSEKFSGMTRSYSLELI